MYVDIAVSQKDVLVRPEGVRVQPKPKIEPHATSSQPKRKSRHDASPPSKGHKSRKVIKDSDEPMEPFKLNDDGESEKPDDSEVVKVKTEGAAAGKKSATKKNMASYDPDIHTLYEDEDRCIRCAAGGHKCYFITETLQRTGDWYERVQFGEYAGARPHQHACVRCTSTRAGDCIGPDNRLIVGPEFMPGHVYVEPPQFMPDSMFLRDYFGRDVDGTFFEGTDFDYPQIIKEAIAESKRRIEEEKAKKKAEQEEKVKAKTKAKGKAKAKTEQGKGATKVDTSEEEALVDKKAGKAKVVDAKKTAKPKAAESKQAGKAKVVDSKKAGKAKAVDSKKEGKVKAVESKKVGKAKAVESKKAGKAKAVDPKADDVVKKIAALFEAQRARAEAQQASFEQMVTTMLANEAPSGPERFWEGTSNRTLETHEAPKFVDGDEEDSEGSGGDSEEEDDEGSTADSEDDV